MDVPLEKIKRFLWLLKEGTTKDLEEMEALEKVIKESPQSTALFEKLQAADRMAEYFAKNPLDFLERYNNWREKRIKRYQERGLSVIEAKMDAINGLDLSDGRSEFPEEKAKRLLKKRMKSWIEKPNALPEVYFLTIYPDFSWKFSHEHHTKLGKTEGQKGDSCTAVFKFTNFHGSKVFGHDYDDYKYTPPMCVLVPKDNRSALFTIPKYKHTRIVWESAFTGLIPGIFALVLEISPKQTDYLKKSVSVI